MRYTIKSSLHCNFYCKIKLEKIDLIEQMIKSSVYITSGVPLKHIQLNCELVSNYIRMFTILLPLLAIICALVYLYFWKSLSYFTENNVVYFKADPIFGHFKDLIFMRKCPADVVSEIYHHKKFEDQPYGGVFIMQTPGIFIRNIELIKRIVITDSSKFIDHYADTHEGDTIGIYNMFLAKGQKWKQIRKQMVQAYTSGRIKNMFHFIDDVSFIILIIFIDR